MVNPLQVLALVLAGLVVAVADALIKKVTQEGAGGFFGAIKSGWMLPVVMLYLAQIVFFVYVFVNNWQLGVVGVSQVAVYSISVLALGVLLFGEIFSAVQMAGVALALVGIFLMNA